MKSLARILHNAETFVFARNLDVGLIDYNRLQNLPGELKVYVLAGEGSRHYLNKFFVAAKI